MNRIAVILMLSVIGAHYGYHLFSNPQDQENWFYVLRGIEGAAAFGIIAYHFRSQSVVLIAALWGLFEEAQTAACGLAELNPDSPYGLCLDVIGPYPYAALAAAAIVFLLRKRNGYKA